MTHFNMHRTASVSAAIFVIFLLFILTGCAGEEAAVQGFFTEEVTVEKTVSVERVYDSEDISFEPTYTLE